MTENHPVPYAPPAVAPVTRPISADEWLELNERPREREETGGLPVAAILGAWGRRWLLATAVGLALAAAVAPAVWYLAPVKYNVFTLLRVASSEPRVLPSDKGGPDAI